MKKSQFIVDMGTNELIIYGEGGVYRQPNIALVTRTPKFGLVAIGDEALKAIPNMKSSEYVVYPVVDGEIKNVEVMSLILRQAFADFSPIRLFQQVEIYVVIPCGLSMVERDYVEQVVYKAGYKDVTLIESILCLLPYLPKTASCVLLLDSGNSDIGIIDSEGIMSGCTVNISQNTINERIKEQLSEQMNFIISWPMAESIKNEIGSLYDSDNSGMEIIGKDVLENRMKRKEINSSHVRTSIHYCYKKLAEIIESVLTTLSINTIKDISENGIYIAGVGSKINGIVNFFVNYLKLPIHLIDDAEFAKIIGLSQMLKNPKYKKFFENTR